MTLSRLLDAVVEQVPDRREARWITAAATGLPVGAIELRGDDVVPADQADAALAMARRRAGGEPLQYVLGSWSFRTLEVQVDRRVLVPRPETEQVVEAALAELRRVVALRRATPAVPGAEHLTERITVVDLGTGSGVIALSLAAEGPPDIDVWATDASSDALEVARANLGALDLSTRPGTRAFTAAGRWYEALPAQLAGRLDVVVSNPPYVSAEEWEALDPVVRDHEPHDALVPGPRGDEALREIVGESPRWIRAGGALVVELAPAQAAVALDAAARAGLSAEVAPDLTGRPRMLVARAPDGAVRS